MSRPSFKNWKGFPKPFQASVQVLKYGVMLLQQTAALCLLVKGPMSLVFCKKGVVLMPFPLKSDL